jgi:predicted DNA-binding transcriptional regulator AlpA
VADHRPDLTELLAALEQGVQALERAAVPTILGELERVRAVAWARLTAPPRMPQNGGGDRLLTAQEVSAKTTLSVGWLYRHADALPFTRRIGRKVLFSEARLMKWLAAGSP